MGESIKSELYMDLFFFWLFQFGFPYTEQGEQGRNEQSILRILPECQAEVGENQVFP